MPTFKEALSSYHTSRAKPDSQMLAEVKRKLEHISESAAQIFKEKHDKSDLNNDWQVLAEQSKQFRILVEQITSAEVGRSSLFLNFDQALFSACTSPVSHEFVEGILRRYINTELLLQFTRDNKTKYSQNDLDAIEKSAILLLKDRAGIQSVNPESYIRGLPERTQQACKNFAEDYLKQHNGLSFHRAHELIALFQCIPEIELCLSSWIELSSALKRAKNTVSENSEDLLKTLKEISNTLQIRQGEPIGEFLSTLQGYNGFGIYCAFSGITGTSFCQSTISEVAKLLLVAHRNTDDREYDRFLAAYLLTHFGQAEDLNFILIEATQPYGDTSPSPLIDDKGSNRTTDFSSFVNSHRNNLTKIFGDALVSKISDSSWMETQTYLVRQRPSQSFNEILQKALDSAVVGLLQQGDPDLRTYALKSLARIPGRLSSEVIGSILQRLPKTNNAEEIEAIGDLCSQKYTSDPELLSKALLSTIEITTIKDLKVRWLGVLLGHSSSIFITNQQRLCAAFDFSQTQLDFLLRLSSYASEEEKETLQKIYQYKAVRDKDKNQGRITHESFTRASQIVDSYLNYTQDPIQSEIVKTLMSLGYNPIYADSKLIQLIALDSKNFHTTLASMQGSSLLSNLSSLPSFNPNPLDSNSVSSAVVLCLTNIVHHQSDTNRYDPVIEQIAKNGVLAESIIEDLWKAAQWRLKNDTDSLPLIYENRARWCDEMCSLLLQASKDNKMKSALINLDSRTLERSLLHPEILSNFKQNILQNGFAYIEQLKKEVLLNKNLSFDSGRLSELLFIEPAAFRKIIQEAGAAAILKIILPQIHLLKPDLVAKFAEVTQRLRIISQSEIYWIQVADLTSHGGSALLVSALLNIKDVSSAEVSKMLALCGLLLSAAHLTDDAGYKLVLTKLDKLEIHNLKDFEESIRPIILEALSSIFPESILKSVSLERLREMAEIYIRYSKSLGDKKHQQWMQAAAIAEIKGSAREWKNGDKKALRQVWTSLGTSLNSTFRLNDMKSERNFVLENSPLNYISKAAQREWKKGVAMHAHVIRDIAIEDRLKSLQSVLEQLISPLHISKHTRQLTGAERDAGVAHKLAQEIRQLVSDGQDTAEKGAIIKHLLDQQKLLLRWQPLWWLINNASKMLSNQLLQMTQLRQELSQARELIEEMGFDFRDSFSSHTYSGELDVLRSRLSEPVCLNSKYKIQREIVLNVLAKWNKQKLAADSCLGNIRTMAQRCLSLFEQKANLIQVLIKSSPNLDNKDNRSSIWNKLRQELTLLAIDPPSNASTMHDALLNLIDADAIRDMQSIISMCLSEEKSSILMYRPVYEFSKALKGFVGQCLDYRAGSNCKSNLAWNEQHIEAVIAYDEQDIARANCILWIGHAGVSKQKKKLSLDSLSSGSLQKLSSRSSDRAVLVIDPVYTPDGSVVSWDKIEGALCYGIQRAHACGMDFVVPNKVISAYHANFKAFIKDSGLKTRMHSEEIKVLPGANGSIYLESNDWQVYNQVSWNLVNGYCFPSPKAKTSPRSSKNGQNLGLSKKTPNQNEIRL